MDYNMKKSGERIRRLRINNGLTQEQVAEVLNISRSFYSRIETGEKGCSIDLFVHLSGLFQVSLDYLILGKYPNDSMKSADRAQIKEDIAMLLYLPLHPPEQADSGYFDALAAEIAALLDACWGHALVLFTSYAAMSAIKERLAEMDLPWDIFTLGRNAVHTTQEFKASPGSVLLATGAAWEGFDFPGDCVSLLVIPRLPFSHPDALKEKKRVEYPTLRAFIKAVVVPEMQIKLKQGFGRAIRTETDTCVVAILDERASPGQRHHEAMLATLPDMEITDSLEDVVEFIYRTKDAGYFHHEKTSDV